MPNDNFRALLPLPIDPLLPEIVGSLRTNSGAVICAPPGAGKTTRVPLALHDAGFCQTGNILILEPRRLAARLASARVAEELGEKLGQTVGYTIRFENVGGPRTRIRFLTEGILARRIVEDPLLHGSSIVILDEFHERHLSTDLALAFLRRLQLRGSRLKLIVMSATIDAEPIADFLGGIPIFTGEGSSFPVEIEYEKRLSDAPVHKKITSSLAGMLRSHIDGDVLAFLPGASEIRQASDAIRLSVGESLLVVPLHGDLPPAEQTRAIQPASKRKIILSTNVAETSITIPNIGAVIDSGLARLVSYSPWNGLPMMKVAKVSKSSAVQRAGRAGRTRAGRVVRLYTESDYAARPDSDLPEIHRADLAEATLMLHGAGEINVRAFPWFEPPNRSAVDAAESLLRRLGALDGNGRLTTVGRHMLRFPVHPRLGRLILEGERQGAAQECLLIAALLSERDIRLGTRSNLSGIERRQQANATGLSDLLELLDLFRHACDLRFDSDSLLSAGLDPRAIMAANRAFQQLAKISRGRSPNRTDIPSTEGVEEPLLIAILTAFPDRVAKRRKQAAREVVFAGGGSGFLAPSSVVHNAPLLVAVDAEEWLPKGNPSASSKVMVRLASAIEPEWLAGLFPEALSESIQLDWNDRAARVDEIRRLSFEQISLEERVRPAPPSEVASQLLSSEVMTRGVYSPANSDDILSLQARIALLAKYFPEERFPIVDEALIADAIKEVCTGKISLSQLEGISLARHLTEKLTLRQKSILERETPKRIPINLRRTVKVHYELTKSPWIESRLQDFWGMNKPPMICAGRTPVTIHLLAPNGRAVQVTQDLAGFWQKHYPSIRRELQRRYPKHPWPEA
ncbi:MAG: ATP-dependent helicase HrpB [Acidobacteria bacterium]|nr:ATP-dependent helicase HrpB [Acidobacteriota bacterium]